MNEKLKNLNKKQFEKCLITLEMLTFETPKIYTEMGLFNSIDFQVLHRQKKYTSLVKLDL